MHHWHASALREFEMMLRGNKGFRTIVIGFMTDADISNENAIIGAD